MGAVPSVKLHAQRFWTGVHFRPRELEFVLLDGSGARVARVEVSYERRAWMRLVRHWIKHYRFDLRASVFCIASHAPHSGALLEWLQEHGLNVALVDGAHRSGSPFEAPLNDAESIARAALGRATLRVGVEPGQYHENMLELLRRRRESLLALRARLAQPEGAIKVDIEDELRREFERLDRRHVVLLDKLIGRIDTLIALRMQ